MIVAAGPPSPPISVTFDAAATKDSSLPMHPPCGVQSVSVHPLVPLCRHVVAAVAVASSSERSCKGEGGKRGGRNSVPSVHNQQSIPFPQHWVTVSNVHMNQSDTLLDMHGSTALHNPPSAGRQLGGYGAGCRIAKDAARLVFAVVQC